MTQTRPEAPAPAPDIPGPTESPERVSDGPPSADDATPTERDEPELAGTRRGRLVCSGFIMIVLAVILISVMPASALRNALMVPAQPVLLVTGLDQGWGVFAPGPRLETDYIFSRVDFADGGHSDAWISNSPGISEYWNYRWRKLGEEMWSDPRTSRERAAFATWSVDQARTDGRVPVKVTLFRHSATNLAPGPGPDTGPWQDIPFYSAKVATS